MTTKHTIVDCEPAEVAAWMAKGEAILIDVREAYEFGFERIPGALLFPLATFDPKALPSMDDTKRVVLQCGTGRRSGMAAQRMLEAGYDVAYHVAGGINAWREAQLPMYGINPTTGAIERRN